jgi:3-oxoacyl-[acyl-carrier-protein] synthase-3
VADQFIKTGFYKNILIVGVEILHHFMDYNDRDTSILFGDGAGAWVVTRAEADSKSEVFSTHMKAEGALHDLLYLPAGGSRLPFSQKVLDEKLHKFQMNGREIFKNAVRTMSHTCQLALQHNNVSIDQVDWLIPHQANSRIMESVADHFKFPKEKVINVVHETANISAATIPVAFQMAVADGRIKRGDLILLTAFGAGLTSGSALLRY